MHLEKSPSLLSLQKSFLTPGNFLFEGLWDEPKALLALLALKATGRSVVLITGGTREDSLFDSLS